MPEPRDIVVTWPKGQKLWRYLEELEKAQREGAQINFRVANRPVWHSGELRDRPARCYVVHDGLLRGYNNILYVTHRDFHEVRHADGGWWPAGTYIVRDPRWFALLERVPMRGFQGWRWFNLEQYRQSLTAAPSAD